MEGVTPSNVNSVTAEAYVSYTTPKPLKNNVRVGRSTIYWYHSTLNASWFIHIDMVLEGILFFVVCVYPQNLYPLSIVEVALPIGKRPFEEFVDL